MKNALIGFIKHVKAENPAATVADAIRSLKGLDSLQLVQIIKQENPATSRVVASHFVIKENLRGLMHVPDETGLIHENPPLDLLLAYLEA